MSNESTHEAVSEQISQADSRGVFFSRGHLDALTSLVRNGENRIEILKRITSNITAIVTDAARGLFEEQPQLIAPGGNAYTNRRMAACLRDMEIILRYITYAFLAGDVSVLDDRLLNSLAETYQGLGVPTALVAVSVQKMKDATIGIANDPNDNIQRDRGHLISELAGYFDYVAATVEGINSNPAHIPLSIDKRAIRQDWITTQETEQKKTVENQVDIFSYIDQKSISTWISEEADEEEFLITVDTTYTLNLKAVESEGGNMPRSSLAESLLQQGLDTEWVVSSSTIELGEMSSDTSITSTPISLKTVWAANFLLHIPIFGDSRILQLQITPRSAEDASLSVLVYACSSLYRQFDIELNVAIKSETRSPIAC